MACGPTVSTGHGASLMISSATEPTSTFPNPARLLVPTTTRSAEYACTQFLIPVRYAPLSQQRFAAQAPISKGAYDLIQRVPREVAGLFQDPVYRLGDANA